MWSAPRTWVTSEVITAGFFNVEIRDNSRFLALRRSRSAQRWHLTSDQTLQDGDSAFLSYQATQWDYGGWTIGGADRLTVPSDLGISSNGIVRLMGWILFNIGSSEPPIGRRQLRIWKNTTSLVYQYDVPNTGTNTPVVINYSAVDSGASEGDYYQVEIFQDTTTPQRVLPGRFNAVLEAG